MGKPVYVLMCIALCAGVGMSPARTTMVLAQTPATATCSGTLNTTPMQGRYTGSWHSNGDYHFAVFNTDLVLTITIDGTLDVTVSPDGRLSGVAKGTVDAPIHHDGIRDVSSGTGTISGIVQGVVTPGGTQITLLNPVIAMQWGTFIPDGYTVPRSITMPNYQFPLQSADCVSFQGGISEQNFPTQFVVADGASGLTQAPGIGAATGNWNLAHVQSATFAQLSARVDSFIANANATLSPVSSPPAANSFTTSILSPLKGLLASIHQNPDISRCLLERLNAWVSGIVPSLRARARGLSPASQLESLRSAADLARFAQLVQIECIVPDDGTAAGVMAAETNLLDRAVAARDWSTAALAGREQLLSGEDPQAVTQHLIGDIHLLLQPGLSPTDKRDVARVAYALGDDADARSASVARAAVFALTSSGLSGGKKHKKRKHPVKAVPARTATPRPKPTTTPTPTATPRPVTLAATLQSGADPMTVSVSGGASPVFSWQPVPGAATYAVFVSGSSALSWAWSGSATSVPYGDTSLPGAASTESTPWPVALPPGGYTWSVLALDGSGHIVGLALRASH